MANTNGYFSRSTKIGKVRTNNIVAMLAGGLGVTFMSNIVGNYLTYYYTEFMLMDAAIVSSILSLGIIIDGVSDYAMGAIIDRVRTKHGKVKHWFLWMSIPAGICSALIFFCNPNWNPTVKTVYLFVIYNIYCTTLTTIRSPQQSMLSVGFRNPAVRKRAGFFMGFSSQLGAAITSTTIAPLLAALGGQILAYRTVSATYCGVGVILCFLAFGVFNEMMGSKQSVENVKKFEGEEAGEKALAEYTASFSEGKERKAEGKGNLLKQTLQLFGNKYWLLQMGCGFCHSIAIGFMFGTAAFFCRYVLGSVDAVGGVFGVCSIGMMTGMLCALPLVAKIESRTIAVLGNAIATFGFIFAAFGSIVLGNFTLLYVGIFIKQWGTGLYMSVNADLTARAIDWGEYKYGERLDGLAYSGSQVMMKICSALATVILGFALSRSGYVGGQGEVTDAVKSTMTNLFILYPTISLAVASVFMMFFNLTDKRVTEIRAEIAKRGEAKKNAEK